MIKHILLSICLFISAITTAQIHVYIIGDSTTENWAGAHWYPCMGWGAKFQDFFNKNKVIVDNRGVGGTSSKKFYTFHWDNVLNDINKGDYLFISFGANDANKSSEWSTKYDEFIELIGKYCSQVRAKGATPVLLTTINPSAWDWYGLMDGVYGIHPQAMRDAAQKYETPFFDLYQFGQELSGELGRDFDLAYRYNNYLPGEYDNYPDGVADNIHLQETGAIDFCRFVVEEIEKSTDERLKPLAEATLPRYNVIFDADDESAVASISRSATFPEGINVTMKSYGVDENKKCFWINDKGELVSKNYLYVYVMQNHDEHFTAIYSDTSILQPISDNFKLLPGNIIFYDNAIHSLKIYTFCGTLVTSATAQFNFQFELPTGPYIMTIDDDQSIKFMINR